MLFSVDNVVMAAGLYIVKGIGQFSIDNINASLCTHLVYTFAGLNIESKITSLDSWNDIDSIVSTVPLFTY